MEDVIPTAVGNAQTYVPGSFTVTNRTGTVNKNLVPLTGVKVTDTLTGAGLDNFTLEKASIFVGSTPLTEGSSAAALTENQYYYDGTTKVHLRTKSVFSAVL